jgi:hypothetical protein
VRNERGKPKAVVQLVSSCKAIEKRTVQTAITPSRIYPILVSDEPIVEAFCFNAYLNEVFQKELGGNSLVQPVTSMSINEFEDILTCVSQNAFSWPDLLSSRFTSTGVGPFSVHQAAYDLLRKNNVRPQRSQVIRKTFDEVWSVISSKYSAQK